MFLKKLTAVHLTYGNIHHICVEQALVGDAKTLLG